MSPEERDRVLELCRLLQVEKKAAKFSVLCKELTELMEKGAARPKDRPPDRPKEPLPN